MPGHVARVVDHAPPQAVIDEVRHRVALPYVGERAGFEIPLRGHCRVSLALIHRITGDPPLQEQLEKILRLESLNVSFGDRRRHGAFEHASTEERGGYLDPG